MSQARYTHLLIVSRAFFEGPPGGPGAQALGIMSRCTNSSARRRSSDISCGVNPSPGPVPCGNGFDSTAAEEVIRLSWVPMTSHRRVKSMTESFALNVGVSVA